MNYFHRLNSLLFVFSFSIAIFFALPTNANNTNQQIIEVQTVLNEIDLELQYHADSLEYHIFTNHFFTLTLTNSSIETATGITVYAPFSSSLLAYTDSEASHGDYGVFAGIWNIDSLASGESATLDLTLFVLGVDVDISLFAQVQAVNETDIDSTPNNNSTQSPMEDDETILTITKSGGGGNNGGNEDVDIELSMTTNHTEVNAGLQFSYILNVTNKGTDNATGVKVGFPLPAQVIYVKNTSEQTTYDSLSGEWNIGNIPSNTTRTLLVDVEVKIGGVISATAEVTATNEMDKDSTPNNRAEEEDDIASAGILGLQIDLELNMELPLDASNIVEQGSEVTFLVHVENKGPTLGYNSKVSAILPEGFEYVRGTMTMGEYLDDLGVWVIGDIPPFETQTMEITATIEVFDSLTYTCEVRTSNVPDVDSTPSNFDPNEDDIDSLTIYIDMGTSIDESLGENENQMSIYPIPTKDVVNVLFTSKSTFTELYLYDFSGHILQHQVLQTSIGANTIKVDLRPFPVGIYFVSLQTKEENCREKVVKR
ncbi:MAG: T9SS type A sorting domain-containing protein [Chitinophagales bacterium]